jgi:MoxR-like ATPase
MVKQYQKHIAALLNQANQVLLGKETRIKLALSTLFANGHLLINDIPGVGKTTLANLVARLFGLDFQRMQFTSDLLPADITGVSIFNREKGKFEFHPGPIFGQLILVDEINRATPKSQSALLEAMEERQVSVDGKTWPLPHPFFVIATQNPMEQAGTFPLPESQLDRFMLSIDLGYPDHKSEREMLEKADPRLKLEKIQPLISAESLVSIQQHVSRVHCSEALLDYLQAIIEFSRHNQKFITGYSPRAGMAILKAAKAWAFIAGREAVMPEDIQVIIPSTIHHLRAASGSIDAHQDLLKHVAIP